MAFAGKVVIYAWLYLQSVCIYDVLCEESCLKSDKYLTNFKENFTIGCREGNIIQLENCGCWYNIKKPNEGCVDPRSIANRAGKLIRENGRVTDVVQISHFVYDQRWVWQCGGFHVVNTTQTIVCREINEANVECDECPRGSVLTKIGSSWTDGLNEFGNTTYKRMWNLTCEQVFAKRLYNCSWTGYIDFKKSYGPLVTKLNADQVFRSMAVFKEPSKKDWKFGFTICSQCDTPRISKWTEWTRCCINDIVNMTTRSRYRECSAQDHSHEFCGCNKTQLREEEPCILIDCSKPTTTEPTTIPLQDNGLNMTTEDLETTVEMDEITTTAKSK